MRKRRRGESNYNSSLLLLKLGVSIIYGLARRSGKATRLTLKAEAAYKAEADYWAYGEGFVERRIMPGLGISSFMFRNFLFSFYCLLLLYKDSGFLSS